MQLWIDVSYVKLKYGAKVLLKLLSDSMFGNLSKVVLVGNDMVNRIYTLWRIQALFQEVPLLPYKPYKLSSCKAFKKYSKAERLERLTV